MEDLRRPPAAPPRTIGSPGRDEHELLDVEPVVGVGAPVDHVHQRKRQSTRAVRPPEVAEEREPDVVGGGAGAGERDAEDRVGAQRLLLGRAVELAAARGRWAACSAASIPLTSGAITRSTLRTACSTPLPPKRRRSPSRSSSASALPVEAPDGTAARPSAPAVQVHLHLDGRVARGSPGSRGRGRRRSRPSVVVAGQAVEEIGVASRPLPHHDCSTGWRAQRLMALRPSGSR